MLIFWGAWYVGIIQIFDPTQAWLQSTSPDNCIDKMKEHKIQVTTLHILKELERTTTIFLDDFKPGLEGFGIVYKGTLENGTKVAIKKTNQIDKESNQYIEMKCCSFYKWIIAIWCNCMGVALKWRFLCLYMNISLMETSFNTCKVNDQGCHCLGPKNCKLPLTPRRP